MRRAAFLAFSLSLGLIASESTAIAAQVVGQPSSNLPVEATTPATPPTLAPMLARVSPAVVNISVQGTVAVGRSPLLQDPLFRDFFGLPEGAPPPTQRFQAAGSGIIYDARLGYVLTNNHVVEHAEKIMVTLTDHRQLDAKLVASDPQTDVAILKVNTQGLTSLPLGDLKTLRVGDYVVAIGNPFGVGQTATFGIVSALGRSGLGIEGYEDFIQTDASINPGNSGGALIDTQGRLVGMNAAIISRGGGNVGIGFAVPIDMIKLVAAQLIAQGKVFRGALGVTVQDLTPTLSQAMNVNATSGAVVSQVMPQSPASKAGLMEGDIITALDGEAITGSSQLRNAIGQKQPGTTARLTFLRDGKERSVVAMLDAQTASLTTEAPSNATPNDFPFRNDAGADSARQSKLRKGRRRLCGQDRPGQCCRRCWPQSR